MATNKRFLGLGFTFTATDKGLEKKLTGINNALQGIADSLTTINTQSQSAGSAMGKMKVTGKGKVSAPKLSDLGMLSIGMEHLTVTVKKGFARIAKSMKGGQRHFIRPTRPAPVMHQAPPPVQKPMSGLFEDVFSKLSSSSKKLISDIERALGPQLGKGFIKEIDHMKVEFNNLGDFSLDTQRKLQKMTQALVETSTTVGKYKRSFEFVKKSFEFLNKWFHDVGSSVEGLLSSVGVNVSEIIPEQIKALIGVAKSVFSPVVKGLISLPKMLLSNLFKDESAKIQASMLQTLRSIFAEAEKLGKLAIPSMEKNLVAHVDQLKNTNNEGAKASIATLGEISDKLGGRPSGAKNAMSLLENISDNTKPQTKGLFDKIGDLFKGIGKKLLGFASLIPGLGFLSKFVKPLGGLFETLGKFLRPVIRILGPIAEALAAVAAAAYLAAAGWSFFKGFGSVIEKNKKVFQDLSAAFSRWMSNVVKSSPMLTAFVESLRTVMKSLTDFGSSLLKLPDFLYSKLPSGFDTVSGWAGEIMRAIVDLFKTLLTNPLDVIKTSLEGWDMMGKKVGEVTTDMGKWATDFFNKSSDTMEKQALSSPAAAQSPRGDLSNLITDQTDSQSKLLNKQIQAQQGTNDLLSLLLRGQQNQTVNANIKVTNTGGDAIQLQALSMGF